MHKWFIYLCPVKEFLPHSCFPIEQNLNFLAKFFFNTRLKFFSENISLLGSWPSRYREKYTPNRRLYKVTDPTFRWIFSLWNENEEIILIDPKIQEILIAYTMLNIYWCVILPVFASFYLFIFAIVIDTDTEYIWFLVRISYLKSCVYSFFLVSG